MSKRLYLLGFACFSSLLFVVTFSETLCGVKVSAEVSGGRYLTPSETIEFYGSDLPCTYYNGSDFVTVTLHPTSNYVYHFAESSTRYETTDYITSSLSWIMYYSNVDVSDYVSNPNYVNIDITPNLTVSDCSDFYAAVATRCSTNGGTSQSSQPSVSASAYDASFFDISAAGQTLRFSNSLLTTQDNSQYLCPCMTRDGLSSYWSCLYVPVEWHTSTLSTVSTLRAGFFGATRNGGGNSARFEVYLSCPYVNPVGASVETGIVTGTTAPPSGGGDTDLTETNGLIGGVIHAVQNLAASILDGLKGLFIPDDDFMDGFKADMQTLLQDHLGGLYEAEQIMIDSFEQLPNVVAKSEIYIPPVTLNLAGTPFNLGDWHVPLKVSGMPAVLYEGIAFIIDFLCLAAFLRMCRNKLEIFLNPDSEVIKE